MRKDYRITLPQVPVRQARLDNLALVPGDLLPSQHVWQAMANRLPRRAILIVLPTENAAQKAIMLAVAKMLSAAGHQVRVIPTTEVR